MDTESLNIRKGPGIVYAIVTGASKGDRLEIIGQAYSCSWLKIKTSNGVEGWVSTDLVKYDLPCNQIPSVPNPQLATVLSNPSGALTLNLSGPAVYSFTYGPGNHDMWVIPGTYTYTAWGCGTSTSGTQKLSDGFEWRCYCQ